ncbi:MAG: HAD family hydrolase [Opitutaceae bacterium]
MRTFDTILFDLDGTLIDHFEAIHRAHAETMTHFGLPAPTLQQVRSVVGGGLELAVERLFGAEHAALLDRAIPFYRATWPKHLLFGVKILPGAHELLTELHGRNVTCAVFTNKLGTSARELCDHLGLTPLLQGVFGALDTPWLKPRREFADHVLNALGAKASATLLIGDSTYDVEAAHNGGFPCWCVTTGTHGRDELLAARADRVCADLPAIQRELLSAFSSA